jgi:hypothetical protein
MEADIENQSILQAKPENKTHTPTLSNGDTKKLPLKPLFTL